MDFVAAGGIRVSQTHLVVCFFFFGGGGGVNIFDKRGIRLTNQVMYGIWNLSISCTGQSCWKRQEIVSCGVFKMKFSFISFFQLRLVPYLLQWVFNKNLQDMSFISYLNSPADLHQRIRRWLYIRKWVSDRAPRIGPLLWLLVTAGLQGTITPASPTLWIHAFWIPQTGARYFWH